MACTGRPSCTGCRRRMPEAVVSPDKAVVGGEDREGSPLLPSLRSVRKTRPIMSSTDISARSWPLRTLRPSASEARAVANVGRLVGTVRLEDRLVSRPRSNGSKPIPWRGQPRVVRRTWRDVEKPRRGVVALEAAKETARELTDQRRGIPIHRLDGPVDIERRVDVRSRARWPTGESRAAASREASC